MKSAQDNSPQFWPGALARSAGRTGQTGRATRADMLLPTDKAAVKTAVAIHGRADARPSRRPDPSKVGPGNEGTGHALRVEQERFSDVAVQI